MVPGSQFLFRGWVQILLKQRKNILCDRFVFKSEYGRKTAPPVSFDSVVLAVIVIVGKVLAIEIRTFAMCGFDLCRGEQKFLSTHPGNIIIRYRKKSSADLRKKLFFSIKFDFFLLIADAISYRDR